MDKYCIKHRLGNGSYIAVLNPGWRYDGSMVVEADSAQELEYKLMQARYDDRWVTLKGNHVLIGGNGRIKAGVGGRLKGRMFGMRFKDYEKGKRLKNGRRAIRVYKDFKGKTKVIGKAKPDKSSTDKAAKQQAIASIAKTHNSLLKPEHLKELKSIIENNMTPEQAKFYDKLTKAKAIKNRYNERTRGYYAPFKDTVHMSMDNNIKEQRAGIPHKGAFMTKFHEEFHQLDQALQGTKFTTDKNGQQIARVTLLERACGVPLTDIRTKSGSKISAAIEKDVVDIFNVAIEYRNTSTPSAKPVKKLTSTARLPRDMGLILRNYLDDHFGPEEKRVQIMALTDAIGLHTKGRINCLSLGYWGHNKAYNKDTGKNGATSETWANFAGNKFGGGNEYSKLINKLMPNTMKACNEVLDEVTDYVNNNWK